jgi:hypothetical protein
LAWIVLEEVIVALKIVKQDGVVAIATGIKHIFAARTKKRSRQGNEMTSAIIH